MSGSFLTISKNNFASNAIIPFSIISPSMIVSIPSSVSLAVSVICPFVVFIRIHSRMDMVVLLGTALETILTPFNRFNLEHIIFMWITPFAVKILKNFRYAAKIYII